MDAVADRGPHRVLRLRRVVRCTSRWCEELILWSTPEFGFTEIGDAFTTGSSIMPQKKNPDVAELVAARPGVSCSLLAL